MKYFSPSYWFKLWVLTAPLFNDKTQDINAKSIDNKNIKDWASKDITSLELINQEISFTNSTSNYKPYNLSQTNQNINRIYQTELETSTHKHRHEKSKNKRQARQKIRGLKSYSKYGLEKELNIQKIKQIGCMWCAPTVAQSVLSYFNYFSDQNYLATQMQTVNGENGGTQPQNLINVINTIINNNNLNNRRNYVYYKMQSFGNIMGVQSRAHRYQALNFISLIIRNSLENNMPVMFAHSYTQEEREQGRGRHFVLIDAFSNRIFPGNVMQALSIDTREYRFMDPADGEHYVVSGDYLYDMIGDDGFLVSMRHPNILPNSSIEENEEQEEQMEIGQCIINTNLCVMITSRKKRNIESNENCICTNNFYYNNDCYQKSFKLEYSSNWFGNPFNRETSQSKFITLNLGKNNPLKYEKIEVLNEQFSPVKANWGNDLYAGTKFSDFLKNKKISDLIINKKIIDENEIKNYATYFLQSKSDTSGLGGFTVNQKIGSTFYWENDNYYLQFLVSQNVQTTTSSSGGTLLMNIGNGVKLTKYINFNSNIETQISEPKICEAKFYYDNGNKILSSSYDHEHTNFHLVTLNLGKNNPINFDKISVLNEQDTYTKSTWGGNRDYSGIKFSYFLKDKKINSLFTNEKIDENKKEVFFNNHDFFILQYNRDSSFLAGVTFTQSIYSTFYWENDNYYLQFLIHQYGKTQLSMTGAQSWINIGDGIKLQKENCYESRKKRNIESNENKWTDKFTKYINHEQHLPIDNKSNFSTNNITSL